MIRLTTLGAVDLRKADGTPVQSVLRQPRRYAILAYLALARPRGFHRRDRVLGVFWPEEEQGRARHRLAQAKHYLTRSLGRDVVVARSDEELGIASDRLTSDVAEFEAALARDDPEAALALYGGELLPGFHIADAPEFERWLDAERSRLARRAGAAAWSLAERKGAAGDRAAAVRWAKRAVALEPWDEGGLRRLITLLDSLADRAGAVAAYQEYAKRLEADLGTEPAAETQALIEAVKRREEAGDAAPALPVVPVELPIPAARAEPADEAAGASGSAPPGAGLRRRVAGIPLGVWAVAASVLLVLLSSILVPRSRPEPEVVRRIAVLPFEDLDPSGRNRGLATGLTADLIERLDDARTIQVVSHAAIQKYAAGGNGFENIAQELGVSLIVDGRIMSSDTRVQVTIALIDALTGDHIEEREVILSRGENLALLRDVVEQAEDFLRPELGEEFRLRAWQAGTASDSAWILLALAAETLERATQLYGHAAEQMQGEMHDQADRLIAQARNEDPHWVEPVLLAVRVAQHRAATALPMFHAAGSDAMTRWLDRAEELATQAIEMEPENPAAHEARGGVRRMRYLFLSPPDSVGDLLLAAAAKDLRTASDLEPNRPNTLNALGAVLTFQGHYADAKVALERALEADAYHVNTADIVHQLFQLSFQLKQDADAGNYCDEYENYMPDTSGAAACKLLIYGWSSEAPSDARHAMLLFANFGENEAPKERELYRRWMAMLTAATIARVGEPESARALATEWLDESYRSDSMYQQYEAALLVQLGEHVEARELLLRLAAHRPSMKRRIRDARIFEELFAQGDAWWVEGLSKKNGTALGARPR
jgi:DNA-binding SARP family transcriptional activator/TolB-like protein